MGNIAFLLAAASAGAYQPQPLVALSTDKSLNAFGSCFVQAQEQAGQAWAFAAANDGGSFTNEGARGVSAAYRLQISSSESGNRLRLYAVRSVDGTALVKAINRCR